MPMAGDAALSRVMPAPELHSGKLVKTAVSGVLRLVVDISVTLLKVKRPGDDLTSVARAAVGPPAENDKCGK